LGNRSGPQVHPVLYLRYAHDDASPKAISGRTSYLPVRLAFHPYPPLIGYICNCNPFGPPTAVTPPSPWPWVAHQVSCLIDATFRPVQTRFRFGSGCACLSLATPINSPAHSPKGTRSRRAIVDCPWRSHRLSANGFRFSFTPLTGVLFTFPSRYWSAIGRQEYLALEGGPPCFPQD
jgi:hypothetical protein